MNGTFPILIALLLTLAVVRPLAVRADYYTYTAANGTPCSGRADTGCVCPFPAYTEHIEEPTMEKTLTLKQYEALLEQAPILSWKANTEALCDYFNERWLAFRGRSLEEEYGNGWAEGVHPDDFDRCLKTYVEAFAKREVFEMEYRLKRYDGVYKWIFDLGVPLYNEGGEFAGYIGSCIVVADKADVQEEFHNKMDENAKMLKGIIPCQKMVCNDK